MKMLRYQVMGYTLIYDPATEQDVRHEAPATIEKPWSAQAEARARQVALGAVEIYDDGEPEPNTGDYVTWDELAQAIKTGVNEA